MVDFQFPVDYLDLSARGHLGLGITGSFTLTEGESITFVLRQTPSTMMNSTTTEDKSSEVTVGDPFLTHEFIERLIEETTRYWIRWIGQCTYTGSSLPLSSFWYLTNEHITGRWREFVQRSALAIKLLTFAPTGAIVAAPTFSLPEDLNGAGRNWDYRCIHTLKR
jgi:GH15 family glucan-1,4-alpha-glucosidase